MGNENTIIEQNINPIRVLIGLQLNNSDNKIAVTLEQYTGIDKTLYTPKGIILRDEEDVNIMAAPSETSAIFGYGPENIPASDKRRKNYINPIMIEINGQQETQSEYDNIGEHLPDDCALCYCINYADGWWLPSAGELSLVNKNIEDVNNAIQAVNGTTFSDNNYWTSTRFSDDYMWFANIISGQFGFWLSKENSLKVRPFTSGLGFQEIINE